MAFLFDFTLFLGFSLLLVLITYSLSFLLSFSRIYLSSFEKISPYECGFNPFDDSRHQFDISFYLIGILFIIFDLEVSFLFPWVMALDQIGLFGFLVMIAFLFVLTIGFIYEWFNGVLD